MTVTNSGISGTGTAQWSPNGALLSGAVPQTATHCFIMLGTNDRGTNTGNKPDVPFFTEDNLREIVLWLKQNRDCEITLISPPPTNANADTFANSGNSHRSDDQARAVHRLAKQLRTKYIPAFENLSAINTVSSVLHNDGLHLNDFGHSEMFKLLAESA